MVVRKRIDGKEAARIMYGGNMSGSIIEILKTIQTSIIVPKTRYNKFGNYNYRNAEDIVEEVKKCLPNGVSLKLTDEIIMLGNRYYIKATAKLISDSGEISSDGWAREQDEQKGMSEPQITGAASSYARKYALNGLFAIDDGVDADSQDNRQVTKATKEPTPEQRKEAAKKKAEQIIVEYKSCKDLGMLADIQAKYHNELKRFDTAYPEIFKEINTVGLQMIASFDK